MSINTKLRLTILASAFALTAAAPVAFAQVTNIPSANECAQIIQTKDGLTLHVFGDGKMAMEDQFGRPAYMEPGHAMQTKDGKKVNMNGNEVFRLEKIVVRKSDA